MNLQNSIYPVQASYWQKQIIVEGTTSRARIAIEIMNTISGLSELVEG